MKEIAVLSLLLYVCSGTSWRRYPMSAPVPYGRIAGGVDTDITEVPYIACLMFKPLQIPFCGGNIVSKNVILTAAHCVRNAKAEYTIIRVGSKEYFRGGEVYQVKEIILHPEYNHSTANNDAAVLILEKNIIMSDRVKIIKLATSEPSDGTPLRISGWGITESGADPDSLQSTVIRTVNRDKCNETYKHLNIVVTESMICAAEKGKDSCFGDNGGPAVFKDELVGLVSWGKGCAHPQYPRVYASIGSKRIKEFVTKYVSETSLT